MPVLRFDADILSLIDARDREFAEILIRQFPADDDVLDQLLTPEEQAVLEREVLDDLKYVDGLIAVAKKLTVH